MSLNIELLKNEAKTALDECTKVVVENCLDCPCSNYCHELFELKHQLENIVLKNDIKRKDIHPYADDFGGILYAVAMAENSLTCTSKDCTICPSYKQCQTVDGTVEKMFQCLKNINKTFFDLPKF